MSGEVKVENQRVGGNNASQPEHHPAEPREIVIVAVHGIGEQFNKATIQSVAYTFCTYYDAPAAIPLGSFYSNIGKIPGAFVFEIPPFPKQFEEIGFAEVYWAPVPRVVVKEGYTLEESKKWARTIVGRIRLRYEENKGHNLIEFTADDDKMLERVLQEMIETIGVLERLMLLAEKAGLFKFDLKQLLVDYLGDVQTVAEFSNLRGEILDRFYKVMNEITNRQQDAHPGKKLEIYVVAHSEGTVVAFLALLKALSGQPPAPAPVDGQTQPGHQWVEHVRGLMTIGSPIDKHLILWPDLWKAVELPEAPKEQKKIEASRLSLGHKIRWRNYYDYGDPVGFKLDAARVWLKKNGWDKVFEFRDDEHEKHDFGFSRYPLPGKAHVDYWQDEDVFGHFIKTVVEPLPPAAPEKIKKYEKPPRTRPWVPVVSYALPYLLASALMLSAVYILYKAVAYCIDPWADESLWDTLKNVAKIASFLGGLTVMTRIPRLTRYWLWQVVGFGLFLLPTIVFGPELIQIIQGSFAHPPTAPAIAIIGLALVLVIYGVSRKYPASGFRPLFVIGLVVLGLAAYRVRTADYQGPVWPVFLAGLGFLYLWWLAALLFDLSFVWHLYIRHSAGVDRLRKMSRYHP